MTRFLTPRRLRYAWLAGALLWAGWLISVAAGPGLVDLAGQVVGADYLEFYAAGATVRLGESGRLYDVAYQSQLQQTIIGPQLRSYYGFITPPFLAWLFAPLATLPYLWSFALWSVLGLAALWASLRLLGVADPRRAGLWALTWFPIFAAVSYGQNSLLSLLLLSLTYWLRRKGRPLAAGLVASLLLYKPQLVSGIALLWLLKAAWPAFSALYERRAIWNGGFSRLGWQGEKPAKASIPTWWAAIFRADLIALLGLSIGGAGLAGVTFWLLPEASRAYVTFARTVLPNLPAYQDFPLWNLHTLWGFWRLLLPGAPRWADALYWLGAAAGLVGFVRFWRRQRSQPELSFAAAICITLWVTPHAMIYDWAVLLIPAILVWQAAAEHLRYWIVPLALLWLAAFLSGPLTRGQLAVLPAAVQISVPALLAAFWLAQRVLRPATISAA